MRLPLLVSLSPCLLVLPLFAADPPAPAPGDLAALNQKFALADHLRFVPGTGDLPCVQIASPLCTARVYLQGAHLAAWQPAGEEPVIFMSSKSAFADGKPIRGGVPIVFPWFAGKADNLAAPGHGLVRTVPWTVASTHEDADGTITLALSVKSSPTSHTFWPGDYEVTETLTLGKSLTVSLAVKNTGAAPTTFEEALHSYFYVGDVAHISVAGLDAAGFLDKIDKQQKIQHGPITFTAETDRVYPHTQGPFTIQDDTLHRKITIEKTNSKTTVVWNPGAKVVADLGPGDAPHYVCVETANLTDDAVTLAPGQTHTMAEHVSLSK